MAISLRQKVTPTSGVMRSLNLAPRATYPPPKLGLNSRPY